MNAPLVTIAIPVYNGERYLAAAIDCALGQTVRDLELIISDNGSSDRTREIAEEYQHRDERIRYTRFEVNQGPVKNFNRAFELARGTYFKFSPHDDIYDPTYIERCIQWLETHPDTVACNTPFAVINEEGRVLKLSEVELHADQDRVDERYYALLNNTKCYDFFSVIRKSALDRLPRPLLGAYAHADGVLLARLGMLGRIHHLEEALYFNRDHKDRSGNKYKTYREYTYFLDPALRGRIVFPRWRMAREFFRSVGMFPLSRTERMRCYWLTVRWCTWYWTSLAWNLVDAAGMILRGEPFTNRSLNLQTQHS